MSDRGDKRPTVHERQKSDKGESKYQTERMKRRRSVKRRVTHRACSWGQNSQQKEDHKGKTGNLLGGNRCEADPAVGFGWEK